MDLFGPLSASSLRYWTAGLLLMGLVVWVGFFDSHSLLRRYQWHQELETLSAENDSLRADIERLRHRLEQPLSDSAVERIAREEYGMKRPNERLYRIQGQ